MSEPTPAERAEKLREMANLLREQSKVVARLYGDPDPPEDDMSPADRLWWTAQDAADELEHMADALAAIEKRRGAPGE